MIETVGIVPVADSEEEDESHDVASFSMRLRYLRRTVFSMALVV
jgi:hypothetical protein